MAEQWDITTYSGIKFKFDDPEFSIYDIAHALSLTCRFCGHSSSYYSVAEHSIHVANNCPEELYLEGLMHDAPEAYLGDVTSPLKRYLSEYRRMEEDLYSKLAGHYKLLSPIPTQVKTIDGAVTVSEAKVLMPDKGAGWAYKEGPIDIDFRFLSSKEAEEEFLHQFFSHERKANAMSDIDNYRKDPNYLAPPKRCYTIRDKDALGVPYICRIKTEFGYMELPIENLNKNDIFKLQFVGRSECGGMLGPFKAIDHFQRSYNYILATPIKEEEE